MDPLPQNEDDPTTSKLNSNYTSQPTITSPVQPITEALISWQKTPEPPETQTISPSDTSSSQSSSLSGITSQQMSGIKIEQSKNITLPNQISSKNNRSPQFLLKNKYHQPKDFQVKNIIRGLRKTQKQNENDLKKLKRGPLSAFGNFQVQFFGCKISSEEEMNFVVVETAKNCTNHHLPKESDFIEINQTEGPSQVENKLDVNINQPKQVKQRTFIEATPYAVLLKEYLDSYNEQKANERDGEFKIKEIYDKGEHNQSRLSTICSERIIKVLQFFGLYNLAVSANVLIVGNESVRSAKSHVDKDIEIQNQLTSHLDFFKERCREFLLSNYVKVQSIPKFGAHHLQNDKIPPKQFNVSFLKDRAPKKVRKTHSQRLWELFNSSIVSPESEINQFLGIQQQKRIWLANPYKDQNQEHQRTRYNNSTHNNKFNKGGVEDHHSRTLVSPESYLQFQIMNGHSPSKQNEKRRLPQWSINNQKDPIVVSREIMSRLSTARNKKELNDTLKNQFKLSDEDYKKALDKYLSALKELNKAHIMELRNLKPGHRERLLIFKLVGYVIRMVQNNTEGTSDMYLENVLREERIKQLMTRVDPFNKVSLATALSILDEIDSQELAYRCIINASDSLGATQCMLKFVYNACVVTIGCRVFGYQGGSVIPSVLEKTQVSQKKQDKTTEFQRPNKTAFSDYVSGTFSPQRPSTQMKDDRTFTSKSKMHIRNKSYQTGSYIKPKHLFYSNETKTLEVAPYIPASIPVFNIHETLPKHVLRDHFDEVELPDIDLYNYQEVSLSKYVPKTSPLLKQHNEAQLPKVFQFQEIQETLSQLPQTNDDILKYAVDHDPENLPTAVLLRLSELMKNRRQDVYEGHNDVTVNVNRKVYRLK